MREILKSIWKHKLSNLLMLLQIVLVIIYFFMTAASIQKAFNICIEVPDVLGDKYDSVVHCQVQADGTDPVEFQKFRDSLIENGIVNEFAYYNTNTASIMNETFGDDMIANLRMERGISQIADFPIQEGRSFGEEDMEEETVPLLAGYELAEKYKIKTGDIIESEDVKYKVIGVMKRGCCWFMQSVSEGLVLSLDTQAVTLATKEETEDIQMHYYGTAGASLTAAQAAAKINDMAEDFHITLRAKVLDAELDRQFEAIWDDNIYWLIFAITIMFMVAIGTASLTVTHLYTRKKDVGIRMALGYSPGRIFSLFAGETVTLALISGALACLGGALMIGNDKQFLDEMVIYTGYEFSGRIAMFGVIGAVCMCVPSMLVLAVVLHKFQPKNLMGGKE